MEKQIHCSTAKFPVISATVHGHSKDIAIVLLHGFPADSHLWRELIPLLSDHYCLIVPDLPGVGKSTYSGDDLSMEDLAGGIIALLDDQQIAKAVVAGHSMGGYVAMAFAACYPERVLGISMIHSSAKADDEEKIATRKKAIALINKGGSAAFIEAMLPPLFSESYRKANAPVLEVQRKQALSVPDKTLTSFYTAMINRPDRLDVLRSAAFPVQWVLGTEDTLAAPVKIVQQTYLGNVNFVVIYNNSSHMAMLECPGRLAADLGHFADYCNAQQPAHLPA